MQTYFKDKEKSLVPSGIYNLIATLDGLDDNPTWDQVCTLEWHREPYGFNRYALWCRKEHREEE